jgi:hypothetical protein
LGGDVGGVEHFNAGIPGEAGERLSMLVIDRLAEDLSRAFPEVTGFSARDLKYMRAFVEAWLRGAANESTAGSSRPRRIFLFI